MCLASKLSQIPCCAKLLQNIAETGWEGEGVWNHLLPHVSLCPAIILIQCRAAWEVLLCVLGSHGPKVTSFQQRITGAQCASVTSLPSLDFPSHPQQERPTRERKPDFVLFAQQLEHKGDGGELYIKPILATLLIKS